MQNLIFTNSNAVTMTSREIADLVDSRHDNVKVAIERLKKDFSIVLNRHVIRIKHLHLDVDLAVRCTARWR